MKKLLVGFVLVMGMIVNLHSWDDYDDEDMSLSQIEKRDFENAQEKCKNGSSYGCYELGMHYELGSSAVKKDEAKAVELYLKSCRMGNTDEGLLQSMGSGTACVFAATAYKEGKGVEKDVEKAKSILKESCDSGNQKACYYLKNY